MTDKRFTQAPAPVPRIGGGVFIPGPSRPRFTPAGCVWLPDAAKGRRNEIHQRLYNGELTARLVTGHGDIPIKAERWGDDRFADDLLIRGYILENGERRFCFVEERSVSHGITRTTAPAVRQCEDWLLDMMSRPERRLKDDVKAEALNIKFAGRLSETAFNNAWAQAKSADSTHPEWRKTGPRKGS